MVYFNSKSNIENSNEKKVEEGTKINWKFKNEASLSYLERKMRKIQLGGH